MHLHTLINITLKVLLLGLDIIIKFVAYAPPLIFAWNPLTFCYNTHSSVLDWYSQPYICVCFLDNTTAILLWCPLFLYQITQTLDIKCHSYVFHAVSLKTCTSASRGKRFHSDTASRHLLHLGLSLCRVMMLPTVYPGLQVNIVLKHSSIFLNRLTARLSIPFIPLVLSQLNRGWN